MRVSKAAADGEMKDPATRRPGGAIGTLIGAAIAAALLIVVLITARPAEVWQLFRSTDPGRLAIAVAISGLFIAARGLRLLLLVESGTMTWWRATLVAAVAQAAALFAPVRTGELALPLMLGRVTGQSFSSGVGTLLASRTLDLATLGIWSGSAVLAIRGLGEPLAIVLSLLLIVLALLLPVTLVGIDRMAVRCLGRKGSRGRRWVRRVRRVRREIDKLLRRPGRLLVAGLVSLVMWGLQWGVAWTLLVGMGHRWPPLRVVAGSTAAAIANLLPFNLIGNLGTLEAGWTAAFTALGVPLQTAAATGVAAHLWGLIFAAFYGLLAWILFSLRSSGKNS